MTTPRRNSLRLQQPHAPPPIPPTLRHSPYLNAPLFTRDSTRSDAGLSDAAEQWLQDTVPQSPHPAGDRRGSITHRPSPSLSAPQHPPPHSAPLTPGPVAPPSPVPSMRRRGSHNPHSLASHSLAPPPTDDQRCSLLSPLALSPPRPSHLSQARSAPKVPRTDTEQSYFPNVH